MKGLKGNWSTWGLRFEARLMFILVRTVTYVALFIGLVLIYLPGRLFAHRLETCLNTSLARDSQFQRVTQNRIVLQQKHL